MAEGESGFARLRADAAVAEYAACGFDAFLPKPYLLDQLGEALRPSASRCST